MHHRQRQTAIDALAIDDDRADAALSLVAALLRAGQRAMLAQRVEQRGPRIEIEGIGPPVDRETYVLAWQRGSVPWCRRLGYRGRRRERESRDPARLEEPPPRCHRSKELFHSAAYVCVIANYQRASGVRIEHPAILSRAVRMLEPLGEMRGDVEDSRCKIAAVGHELARD